MNPIYATLDIQAFEIEGYLRDLELRKDTMSPESYEFMRINLESNLKFIQGKLVEMTGDVS